MSSSYPYATTHDVLRGMPSEGRSRESILAELEGFAHDEDKMWETGKCSGTMYCGDHTHYEFLGKAFNLFSHMNALQRDMCPSMTKFEGEIIAMTLDMLHGEAITETEPAGLVTSGGSGSILHAVLAYREYAAQQRGITQPNFVKPETAHPAFDKACHLLGVECRNATIDPVTMTADVAAMAALIDENTIAMVGSACNYGYGTIDPIAALSDLALERGIGLHVDGCLGGFILPWGQELGHPNIPVFDFRNPGVTSISADTHKYGYGLKGASVLAFRDKALRNSQYFLLTGWTGGKYASPGIEGSRSGGILASTWASLVSMGRDGYMKYARAIFDTADKMQEAVLSHPELRLLGAPTFCFSFTSDEFDIYHVNDFMRTRGWRFNGQQYPNAIHMAVTRPQTQPGLAEAFAADLADAIVYAHEHADEKPMSAAIYGGVEGGLTDEADEFIRSVMEDMLDKHQGLPRPQLLPRYIALLRGVNVAGQRKVPMADLRALVETIGHTDVRTYIQSGNVVFGAKSASATRIRAALEKEIEQTFGFEVTVLIRTAAELAAVVKRNPFGTDAYVTFLDGAATAAKVKTIDADAFAPDEFKVHGHEVFLRCPNGYGTTKINNTFFERKLETKATTRNWKTVTTLLDWATTPK